MEQAIRCLAPIQPWPLGRSSGPVRLSGRTCGTRSRSGAAPTAGTRDRRVGTAARQVGRAGAVGTCCPLVCTARKRSDGPGAEGRGGAPLRGELT